MKCAKLQSSRIQDCGRKNINFSLINPRSQRYRGLRLHAWKLNCQLTCSSERTARLITTKTNVDKMLEKRQSPELLVLLFCPNFLLQTFSGIYSKVGQQIWKNSKKFNTWNCLSTLSRWLDYKTWDQHLQSYTEGLPSNQDINVSSVNRTYKRNRARSGNVKFTLLSWEKKHHIKSKLGFH